MKTALADLPEEDFPDRTAGSTKPGGLDGSPAPVYEEPTQDAVEPQPGQTERSDLRPGDGSTGGDDDNGGGNNGGNGNGNGGNGNGNGNGGGNGGAGGGDGWCRSPKVDPSLHLGLLFNLPGMLP